MGSFKIEQFVEKIKVPIVCKAEGEELSFDSSEDFADRNFDKYYLIDSVEIADGKSVMTLLEKALSDINHVGDEIAAGSDWIKDHVDKYEAEPNMLDGV